jgi:hypothetical protein
MGTLGRNNDATVKPQRNRGNDSQPEEADAGGFLRIGTVT